MNVREEDKQKSNCSGRGFGLAAAAIGVGVGAALYYFFNQRQEHPDTQGSTSDGWETEQPHALNEDSDSYTTISEHSTTDTSIHRSDSVHTDVSSPYTLSSIEDSDDAEYDEYSNDEDDYEEYSLTESESSESEPIAMYNETGYMSMGNTRADEIHSDLETATEWDVTTDSIDIPSVGTRTPLLSFINSFTTAVSPNRIRRSGEDDRMKRLREQTYRERSWTLEECSICFDVMLRNQELMKLPCSHNFHSQCIMPWLQEKQTCPNCRKEA